MNINKMLTAVIVLLVAVLGLSVYLVMPSKKLGGQYNTNYAYFNGLTNSGATVLSGTNTVSGDTTFTGAATFSGEVTGIATSSLSTLTVTGASVLNGGLTMDTSAFTVADTSGNTSIGGTLGVTGVSTLATTTATSFTASLLANLNGGIAVDTSVFTVDGITGNISTNGTLAVTGNAYSLENMSVGTTTMTYDLWVTNGANTSTLAVGGAGSSLVSKICAWSGTYFVIGSPSTTGAGMDYTTSTVCQ